MIFFFSGSKFWNTSYMPPRMMRGIGKMLMVPASMCSDPILALLSLANLSATLSFLACSVFRAPVTYSLIQGYFIKDDTLLTQPIVIAGLS